jgi:hypothetical protein
MLKKMYVIIFLLILVVAGSAWAQESGSEAGQTGSADGSGTVFERFPGSLGAYINYPVGGGLTYQRWFDRVGVEATIGAIADPSGNFNYNVQGAFQYMLYGEDFADWFSGALYTNVILAHSGDGYTTGDAPAYYPHFYLGLGVGIEMVVLRHISTSVEFMYVGFYPLAIDFGFGGSLKYRY